MKEVVPVAVFLLAGCVAGNYEQRPSEGDAAVGEVPPSWQTAQAEMGEVQVGWISSFGDELLSRLVAEALAHNRDLEAAAATVGRAWALARQAGAAITPTVGLSAGAQDAGLLEGGSDPSTLNVGVQANWELDLWGRIRSGRGAAVASAQAAEADYRYAQHSLAGGVG